MISLDTKELKQFQTDLKIKRQSQVTAVIRSTLNDQAFDSRTAARTKTIPKMFNNRSKWVAGSIIVEKAKGKNTKKLASYSGAKKRWGANKTKDFDGMAKQEHGGTIRKPAIETEVSRSRKVFPGRVSNKTRNQNSESMFSELNFSGSGRNRVIAMIRALDRKKHAGPFRVSKNYKGFKKGVYRFKSKKIKLNNGTKGRAIEQTLDLSQNRIKVPKRQWLNKANKIGVTSSSTTKHFIKNYKYFTKPRKNASSK